MLAVARRAATRGLQASGLPPLMSRLFAARGITDVAQVTCNLAGLLAPQSLSNNQAMAKLLADAIGENKKLLVIGDYDADGATATAVAVKGLRTFGADVNFLVPNRFEYGYGLTPEIVALAATQNPDVIITVDNGIASVDGVAAANALGIQVLITDHHLPGQETPQAACIINPNQHGCTFTSKNLAGVGVMFYLLVALRAELRKRGKFTNETQPKVENLLDLVALGTVADVAQLDAGGLGFVCHGRARLHIGLGRREHNVGQALALQLEHPQFDDLVDQAADAQRELFLVGEEREQHADGDEEQPDRYRPGNQRQGDDDAGVVGDGRRRKAGRIVAQSILDGIGIVARCRICVGNRHGLASRHRGAQGQRHRPGGRVHHDSCHRVGRPAADHVERGCGRAVILAREQLAGALIAQEEGRALGVKHARRLGHHALQQRVEIELGGEEAALGVEHFEVAG